MEVTVGESVRLLRELQEMSQNQLATATGIPQSTISAIQLPTTCKLVREYERYV
ncbi:MAG: helix-turn-helix transcriptional regulator [Chromatocurvus sp.]